MKFPHRLVEASAALLLLGGIGCGKRMNTPAIATSQSSAAAPSTQTPAQPAPFAKPSPNRSAENSASQQSASEALVIPSGTPITVRLLSTVSSASSHPGDRFDATLEQAIVIDGKTVAPEGAQVTGRVIAARHSGRLMHPGYLRIALASLTLDGKTVPVRSTSVMVAGASHKRRNLAWIGGGAGGGALIGAIASGGTGALIGSAIGGAGGTTTAFVTGKKDVGFAAERRLTFRLTREVNAG